MDKFDKTLLLILAEQSRPLTCASLSITIGVSTKTIQRHLQTINDCITSHGAEIISTPSKGVTLEVKDSAAFACYMQQADASIIPSAPAERVNYTIVNLLRSNERLKTQDLADELYISFSQFNQDLKSVKRILSDYNLEIDSRPTGIKVYGHENDRRLCLSNLLSENPNIYLKHSQSTLDFEFCSESAINAILEEQNIRLSEIGIRCLQIHILIAIDRITTKNVLMLNAHAIERIQQSSEYLITTQITEAIKNTYHIHFPESEICYLAQHLIGRQHLDIEIDFNHIEVTDEVKYLVNLILKSIFNTTSLDFYYDKDLYMNLVLHMIPFLDRIKNNTMTRNPIFFDIKDNYHFSYELASIGLNSVCAHLNTHIIEDEISFFALHFILALERLNVANPTFNVLLVSNYGRTTPQLLSFQIHEYFKNKIKIIKNIELYKLQDTPLDSFDFILTTSPLPYATALPTLFIEPFLSEKQLVNIEKFISESMNANKLSTIIRKELFFNNLKSTTKLDAIQEIIDLTSQVSELPNNFFDSVIEREYFAATELSNLVAIPHPIMPISSETFVSVGLLKKPILWHKKQVQIIFLLSISPNNTQQLRFFYEDLIRFVANSSNSKKLIDSVSYDSLITLLSQEI